MQRYADVGMIQAATALASRSKRSLNFVAWESLDRNGAVESHVAHLRHFTHATLAQERDDFIRAESCAGG